MTLTTTNVKNEYTGNGATVLFNVTFQFWKSSELDVFLRVIATGVETLQIENVDYTVTGGNGTIGDVDFTIDDAPPPATVEVHIRRNTTRDQQKDLTPLTKFPSAATEEALDRAAMSSQEEDADRRERFLRIPVTDIPVAPATAPNMELPSTVLRAVANAVLGFDVTTGDPTIVTGATLPSVTVSAAGADLIDEATFALMRAKLDVIENFDDGAGKQVPRIAADTKAARSAPATFGIGLYFAHDDGTLFWSDGAAWFEFGLRQFTNALLPAGAIAGLVLLDTDNRILLRDNGATLDEIRPALPRGSLGGLGMTLSGTTDVSVAVGECRAGTSADRSIMNGYLTTPIIKQLDNSPWAAGNNAAGRPSADALGANKWHHVFLLVHPDGSTEIGFDDDVNGVNLLADGTVSAAGFTRFRRLGSVKETGAGTGVLLDWAQHGDLFHWKSLTAIGLDVNLTGVDHSGQDNLITLGLVPPDVRVEAIMVVRAPNATNRLVVPGDVTIGADVQSVTSPMGNFVQTLTIVQEMRLLTNASQQINTRVVAADNSSDLHIEVHGFDDARGRWD